MDNQVEILGYVTKNFDISLDAYIAFSNLKSLLPELSSSARNEVLEALKLQDNLFGLEKSVYELGDASDSDKIEEAAMLAYMSIYSLGKVSTELDYDIIDTFMYLNTHIEQIRNPRVRINQNLPIRIIDNIPTKNIKNINNVKPMLRKISQYSTELLNYNIDEDCYSYLSCASNDIDRVYTYYKFGDYEQPVDVNNYDYPYTLTIGDKIVESGILVNRHQELKFDIDLETIKDKKLCR